MSMQWPLILFTTLVAWSCGLLGALGAEVALERGEAGSGPGAKARMRALVASAVLLVAGGVAVFFHLQHWERIFNGFGHVTSGITQELVMVVVAAVAMVVLFACFRRSGDGTAPAWAGWLAVVAAVLLVVVAGHSYMMPARPAWDTWLGPLSLVGEAAAMGPLTLALAEGEGVDRVAVVCAVVCAVLACAYAAAMMASAGSFSDLGYYFDPTRPNARLFDAGALMAAWAPLSFGGGVVLGGVAPALLAWGATRSKEHGKALVCAALACAVVGAVYLRCAFYGMGADVLAVY